jgi:hypothetical protein
MAAECRTPRRWWIVVAAILCVGFLIAAFTTSRPKSSAHSLAFLKGAKQIESKGGMMTVNKYVAGGPSVPTQIRRQEDVFEVTGTYEEVMRIAQAEVSKGAPSMLISKPSVHLKYAYLHYQEKGGTVSIQIQVAEDRSKTKVIVTEYPPLTWLDSSVAWVKNLFGR